MFNFERSAFFNFILIFNPSVKRNIILHNFRYSQMFQFKYIQKIKRRS